MTTTIRPSHFVEFNEKKLEKCAVLRATRDAQRTGWRRESDPCASETLR